MNHVIKKSIAIALLIASYRDGIAQNTINASSQSVKINNQYFEYAIGEMILIETSKTKQLIVTQGFLQPKLMGKQEPTEQNNVRLTSNSINIYPNPTQNTLNVTSETEWTKECTIQLLDAQGKILMTQQTAKQVTPYMWLLDLQRFASGNYFLNIQQANKLGNHETYSFKISKIN